MAYSKGSSVLSSVLAGGHAPGFDKGRSHFVDPGKPGEVGNGLDGQVCVFQESFCPSESAGLNLFKEGVGVLFREVAFQCSSGGLQEVCQVVYGKGLVAEGFNGVKGLVDKGVF